MNRLNPQTEADKVASANGWTNAQACGYLDGKRDRQHNVKPSLPIDEMTEYAHGYFLGYRDDRYATQVRES